MSHVGIDLGTTRSSVAHVNEQGVPTLFPDHEHAGVFSTASVVSVSSSGCLVGREAEDFAAADPSRPVARHAKLDMGSGDAVYRDHLGREWSAEAVSALILRKLKRDSEASTNEGIATAAIGVPAQFGDRERRATMHASRLADLADSVLVEEPVAAAAYYRLRHSGDQTLLVYDLGGGKFEATVLQASPDGIFVIATEGCRDLGGTYVDEAVMQIAADEFWRASGIDPLEDAAAALEIRRFAEEVKKDLGRAAGGFVRRALLVAGKVTEIALTGRQFERAILRMVDDSMALCERSLESASLNWGTIDAVLLTGGSTLLDLVGRRLRETSGLPGARFFQEHPLEAVTYGAALVAAARAGSDRDLGPSLVQRIASYDLGMRVWDRDSNQPAIQSLIARNTPLPAEHKTIFYTTRADQTQLVFELVQSRGAGETVASLGNFTFGPIHTPRKNYPVEVTVAYDGEGIVTVTARDSRTGEAMEHVVEDRDGAAAGQRERERQLVAGLRIN